MITTITALLMKFNLAAGQTVYRGENINVLNYPLAAGDFFELTQGMQKGRNYYDINQFYTAYKLEKNKRGVPELLAQVNENLKQVPEIKRRYRGTDKKELLKELRQKRRIIQAEIAQHTKYAYETVIAQYGENLDELKYFEYKNWVLLTSFANMTRMVSQLKSTKLEEFKSFPWLTTSLIKLQHDMIKGWELGIVGGPCLFGRDEILLQVDTNDGESELFDCSCGRNCGQSLKQQAITLKMYFIEHQHEIKNLHILNHKRGITKQEYNSLLYTFEIASLLDGKVVIPLPDFSYIKYMNADFRHLDEPLRQRILAKFQATTDTVTDLYINIIEKLKKNYPQLSVTVLHRREQELCRMFYEQREPYIRNSAYMRKLTNSDGRKDAVTDYVTMLALPYYLYGIRHIVQVDSLDETDSARKCQKIHGNDITLHSLLYPEFISRDGKNTVYHAGIEYKDYMEGGE